MKKKLLTHAPLASVIFAVIGSVLFAPVANAQSNSTVIGSFLLGGLDSMLAWLLNRLLWIMHYWVTVTGVLFNVSINLTLHIKSFVDSTQGVYMVWQTIRDISGLFIIFMLLYAAFKIIIGYETAGGVGNLIKNIVIAGILINFSFFITSLLIDASNVISLALYKGIVAGQIDTSTNINTLTSNSLNGTDTGLGDIFMQQLNLQSDYGSLVLGDSNTGALADPLKIIIQGLVGCIIMFTVGFSFLLAALAFVARLGILIILLAFSPIWFASLIIPALKEKSDHFTGQLKSQLMFMPVYLLLLYGSILVLTKSTVFSNISNPANSATGTSAFITSYAVLAINDFFIIFLLNLPLVTAFTMGGMATDWLKGMTNKFNAANVWKNVGGFAGTHTVGRAAYATDKWLGNTRIGNTLLARDLRAGTTGALAKSKMGGGRSHDERVKELKDVARKDNEIKRRTEVGRLMASGATPAAIRTVMNTMGEKEKIAFGAKNLKNIEILKHLKSGDFEAIKKSDELSDDDKREIGDARKNALQDAITKGQPDVIKHMVENMDGKDLLKLAGTTATPGMLTNPGVIEQLKPNQLKTLDEEGLDPAFKTIIAAQIKATPTHRSKGFILKNAVLWP